MGWRGVLRSIAASSARAARQQAQSERAYARAQQKHFQAVQKLATTINKQNALAWAQAQIQEFEARLDVLRSMHAECQEPIQWQNWLHAPEPPAPVATRQAEDWALHQLATHQPGFVDKLTGKARNDRAQLEAAVVQARHHDHAHNQQQQANHQQAVAQFAYARKLASGVLEGSPEAYRAALNWRDAYGELEDHGSRVDVSSITSTQVEVDLFVNSDDVIPSEVRSLSAAGKLSSKKMPASQNHDIYQDYVCGSALRVARETFAVLPVREVLVHAIGDVLNTASGHVEHEALLSVLMPREVLERLNFAHLDASDSMSNFAHRMKFQKSKGLLPVEPLAFGHSMVSGR